MSLPLGVNDWRRSTLASEGSIATETSICAKPPYCLLLSNVGVTMGHIDLRSGQFEKKIFDKLVVSFNVIQKRVKKSLMFKSLIKALTRLQPVQPVQ